jgi:hypothetical protein
MIRSEPNPRRSQASPSSRSSEDDDPFVDEVADAVAAVFASVEPTRDDLVTTALRNRAHPTVIAALRALPSRRYRNLQQMRSDLLRQQQR